MSTTAGLSSKRQTCDVAKFLAALAVVNGHIVLFGNYDGILVRFMNLGACCVALFFFFSGYGLVFSYRKKGNDYLKSFLTHRLGKVVLPLIVAYAITLPVYAMQKGPINWYLLVETLGWGGPYLKYSWYVTEIIGVYVLFYVSMKNKMQLNSKLLILSMLVLIFMGVLWTTHQPIWYIVSLLGFIIGIWWQRYEEKVLSFLKKCNVPVLILVVAGMWFVVWQWPITGKNLLQAYRYEFAAMFVSAGLFPVLIALVIGAMRITPSDCCVTRSYYEIYLVQNCAMIIASSIAGSFASYWVYTMVAVLLISAIQFQIDRQIYKLIGL